MAANVNPGALAGVTGVEKPSHAIAAGLPKVAERHEKSQKRQTGMAAAKVMTPDLQKSKSFLDALDPTASAWTFQTFDDDGRRKDGSLARVFHGTFDQHAASLAALQAKGAGVFVTVNETNLEGRKAANIKRVRALFVDLDRSPLEPVTEWEAPHIICETSPERWHAYWLVQDCPLSSFSELQRDLAEIFGGDPSVKDLPRVMRLPGFYHLKGAPFMVRMIDTRAFPALFSVSEFRSKLDAIKPVPKLSEQVRAACVQIETGRAYGAAAAETGAEEVAELLSYIPPDCGYADWLAVLMGLHDKFAGSQAGLALADQWSAKGMKYKPGEVADKWSGFQSGKGTSWATVPALARASGADLGAVARLHGGGAQKPVSGQRSASHGQDNKAPPKPAFAFVPVADLEYRAPDYIIGDLIETETLGLIFGDPGCGKSFLAVDIALSVATGTPFHGRDTKQGSVFFIAGEGHNGLARRFAAWSQARQVLLAGVPLFKSERAAQFLDLTSAKAVADAVADLAAWHGLPALIIIDTLARNFGAGDENNTKDMSVFVAAMDDLKARFPGCSVLIVHHSGHAAKERARGAIALKGALDCEFRVEKEGAELKLVNTKMKDAEPPEDIFFRFRQIDLDATTQSAVLEATEAPQRQHKLTPAQRLAQETYVIAGADKGVWDEAGFQGVHVEDWREAFYRKHTGDTADAKRKAFGRVRKDLTDAGLMAVSDDVYTYKDVAVKMAVLLQRDKRDMAGQMENVPLQRR